jgi:hypothetical protein
MQTYQQLMQADIHFSIRGKNLRLDEVLDAV